MAETLAIYCADVGSVASKRFGWASMRGSAVPRTSEDIHALAAAVADDVRGHIPVALGFECPLFVPITEQPAKLTSARNGEGNRAWSAGAGCGALATGLTQVVWLLREIRRLAPGAHQAFVDWPLFRTHSSGLFVWEAFVSGTSKGITHAADALAAVKAFGAAMTQPLLLSAVTCPSEAYSLVGAALLRTGWSTDLALLSSHCIVIRAIERGV